AVVRGKGSGQDEGRRDVIGQEIAGGNRLLNAMGRFPTQGEERGLLLVSEIIQPDRIGASADQTEGDAVFGKLAAAHPGVNNRIIVAVNPEAGAVGGFEEELVIARLLRQERAAPMDGEA